MSALHIGLGFGALVWLWFGAETGVKPALALVLILIGIDKVPRALSLAVAVALVGGGCRAACGKAGARRRGRARGPAWLTIR